MKGPHRFNQTPTAKINRSVFNRSHTRKTAIDVMRIYPILVDEVVPGDTFHLKSTIFARLQTMLQPVMDNMYLDTFYFFVPLRLVWDNFQKFCGEQIDPGDSTDYLVPVVTCPAGGFDEDSLYDHLGIPPGIDNLDINNLYARAYQLIWNEWFRDQNLHNSAPVDRDDGPDTDTDYHIQFRCKKHDYFTSCLPWTQKGTEVDIPLGTSAPVIGNGDVMGLQSVGGTSYGLYTDSLDLRASSTLAGQTVGTPVGTPNNPTNNFGLGLSDDDQYSGVIADLSEATAATINSLRQAFQIQRMYERDARGGTRYTEIVQSHFLVRSPDARLQRPEFLGGDTVRLTVDRVMNASGTGTQGDLAAQGMFTSYKGGFHKSFTEHGIILGLASVRADLTYQQGVHRMFRRSTRFDFYWPALAHLGEQAVLSEEIYADGTANDQDVFGYQGRYDEMRYKNSEVIGAMRSDHTYSLDVWHMSEDFGSRPVLNSSFMTAPFPVDRVIAVTDAPPVFMDVHFDYKCARAMPTYAVPGMMDHF